MSLKSAAWRTLIIGHRWLGIATCLLFALWFASGLVMMYVGFPSYTAAERRARLEAIDWRQVRVEPARVPALAGFDSISHDLRLEMLDGEPVYRLTAPGRPRQTVSAVTGDEIGMIDARQAGDIVEHATGTRAAAISTIQRDQWTVAGSYDAHRPLHRVALGDAAGLELYVSSHTGEIVLDTCARERGWNRVGAVLHWLYFTGLRARPQLWSQVVMWTSGIGVVVAMTGLWLGIDRLRVRRRAGSLSITPFRGWMAWHHLAGLIGGVFLLTWIFSGWLSMDPPVPWDKPFDAERRTSAVVALAGQIPGRFPVALETLRNLGAPDARTAAFSWALDRPQIEIERGAGGTYLIDAHTGARRQLSDAQIVARAGSLMPGVALLEARKLVSEDAYWYSRRSPKPLPVWRFMYADADRTWIHIDPATGRLVGWLRDSDRLRRWLFNSLHSLDFRWLLAHRPAWDILMWALGLAGLAISISSIVVGWRALRR